MNQFYNESGQKYYDVEFITPTSFKSNGRYMIYPDLGMIYRSLMKNTVLCQNRICMMKIF